MPISISVEVADGIPPKHLRELGIKACEWFSDQVEKRHLVQVVLVNAPRIIVEGDECHGSIWYDEDSIDPEVCVIYVASNYSGSRIAMQDQHELFLSTIFHELSHYEQIRDGKRVTERGRDTRSKVLMERFFDEVD